MNKTLNLLMYFYCLRQRIFRELWSRLSGLWDELLTTFRISGSVLGWGFLTVLVLLALWLLVSANKFIDAVKKHLTGWLDKAIFCYLDSEDYE